MADQRFITIVDDQLGIATSYLTPLRRLYNTLLDGETMRRALHTQGAAFITDTYFVKVWKALQKKYYEPVDRAIQATQRPKLYDFLVDNFIPIFLLHPLYRLITLKQASPTLFTRFETAQTYSQLASNIIRPGFLTGCFRGILSSSAFFLGTYFPAYVAATHLKQQKDSMAAFLTFLAANVLLYPLDTMRTILFADTKHQLSTRTNTGWRSLVKYPLSSQYSGVLPHMFYQSLLFTSLYLDSLPQAQVSYEGTGAGGNAVLPLIALLYPALTYKVRSQLAHTPLSTFETGRVAATAHLYRGVVPFVLLWTLFRPRISSLYSEEKIQKMNEAADKAAEEWFKG